MEFSDVLLFEILKNSTDKKEDQYNSNISRHEPENKAAEGGILSGHGPLDSALARFLVQTVIIIALSRFLHIFLQKLHQPRVIAELVGGICLGPSVLGNIPGFTDVLFKPESVGFLSTVSNIGMIFYLFLIGLEIDPQAFFNHIRVSTVISIVGIVVPFGFGAAISYGLYVYLDAKIEHVSFASFLIFTGIAMTITAFPVLARILNEKKLLHTNVGLISISASAIDDAIAWTLLTLLISNLNAGNPWTVVYVFLLAASYTLLLLFIFRPLLSRLFDRFLAKSSNPVSQFFVASVFICIFLTAYVSELIGLSAIFGAFLFGLIIPRGHNIGVRLTEKIEDVITIVFLPLFFASSGLKTNIYLLKHGVTWTWLVVVVIAAFLGKFFACAMCARLLCASWRESVGVGALMNTKGLVVLIVLNIGYDAKIINDRIFLIFVIMALITTFVTSPILSYVYPSKYHRKLTRRKTTISDVSAVVLSKAHTSSYERSSSVEQLRVLLCVDDPNSVPSIGKLLRLFKVDNYKDDLIVNCLKIVETSERPSDFVKTSQISEAIKSDPTLNLLGLFGTISNIPTTSFMSQSPTDDICDEVNEIAGNEDCNLIILPWSRNCQEKIKNIVVSSTVTTAIYVPHKFNVEGTTSTLKKILVPFYGGLDDNEVVKFALRFYRQGNVAVTMLHVSSVERIPEPSSDVQLEFIKKFVSSRSDDRLIFKQVETMDVAKTVAEHCKIASYDLMVVGRDFGSNRMDNKFNASFQRDVTTNGTPVFRQSCSTAEGKKKRKVFRRSATIATEMGTINVPNPALKKRPAVINDTLGQLGETLYKMNLCSLLIIHRNTEIA